MVTTVKTNNKNLEEDLKWSNQKYKRQKLRKSNFQT